MVRDCRPPANSCRRILTWLPSWSTFSKPNFAKILRTSCPERVLSFGMDERLEFEGGEHRRIFRQIKLRKILALQVKADRLSQVFSQLIERLGLGHDRKIQTLGDVLIFAFENADLNNLLHGWPLV